VNKTARRARAAALGQWLRQTFPAVFDTVPVRPLAIGLHLEIRKQFPELAPSPLFSALAAHCHRRSYRQAVAAGGQRIDLNGAQAGAVTDSEREDARQSLRAARKGHGKGDQGQGQAQAGKPPEKRLETVAVVIRNEVVRKASVVRRAPALEGQP